jgi:hypothetical protein
VAQSIYKTQKIDEEYQRITNLGKSKKTPIPADLPNDKMVRVVSKISNKTGTMKYSDFVKNRDKYTIKK